MIKKIFTILFVFTLITACGKKSDPIYNGKNNYKQIFSTQQSTLSWFIKKIDLESMDLT